VLGNILKVIAALIIGCFAGLLCGGVLGILLGLIPSLLFPVIFYSGQAILMSIFLSVTLGALLGYLEVRVVNSVFDLDGKPLVGSFIGAIFGLLCVIFGYGVLDSSDSNTFNQGFYAAVLIYSGAIGIWIGAIVFSIFGAVQTIQEITSSYKPLERYK